MERAPINGSPAAPPVPWSIKDPATGKVRPIRELTDQEIVRHLQMLEQQVSQVMQHAVAILQKPERADADITQAFQIYSRGHEMRGFCMVLQYEQHRRAQVGIWTPGR